MCTETPTLSCRLPASTEAPQFARRLVEANLCPDHTSVAALPALLLVSELVGYAVVYGVPPFVLEVDCQVHQLRIAVTAHRLPEAREPSDAMELHERIIDKVARDWGVERHPGADVYWCTLPTGVVPSQRQGSDSLSRQVASVLDRGRGDRDADEGGGEGEDLDGLTGLAEARRERHLRHEEQQRARHPVRRLPR